MSAGAVAALGILLVAAGGRLRGLLASAGQQRPFRWALFGIAGALLLYLALLVLDLAQIPWHPLAVLSLAGGGAAGMHLLSRRHPPGTPAPLRPGWGDGVALAMIAVIAVAALQLWAVHPDFIYHWGLKAQRFAQAGGIDAAFLAQPWNLHGIHPAYPHLAPALFAFTARLLGEFHEPAMMLWTAALFAAMLAACRQVLAGAGCSPFGSQSTLALTALAVATAGIGLQTLGGPDWVIAALPLLAWPSLQRPGPAAERALGLVAALGVGAKMEGIPLAAFLAGTYLLVALGRRWWERRREIPGILLRLALPPLLVALPWLWIGWRHGLFAHSYRGAFAAERAGVIFTTIAERLSLTPWHGLGWTLALLPLLFASGKTRPIALALAAQLAFYLYAYFASPFGSAEEVRFYVQSNFARLAFHLVPTLLVGGGLLLDRWCRGIPPSAPGMAGASPRG